MRFLLDNNLPLSLARYLEASGHEALHVAERGLDEESDLALWKRAIAEDRVVISKDEDFLFLANRVGDPGRLLWIRLGNCRKQVLLDAFGQSLPEIIEAFADGQTVVELA